MNNKTHSNISLISLINLFLISLLCSCSTPQYQSDLSAKESRMSEELLRSQVLRYKAEAEKDLSVMAKFYAQYSPADAPFTPEISASISTALAVLAENKGMRETMIDYSLSLDRYFLFYDKLKEIGGDVRGLEIDFDTPVQEKYYSPPIKDPDAPASETKNREKV